MDTIRDIVEFQSEQFAPVLPEDSQVNPEVYGAELAFWLCADLARRGVTTSYPQSEDWGWFIEYITATDSEFAVHCGNIEGAKDHWLLSLRRYSRKMFGRDKPPYSEAEPLVSAIQAAVQAVVPSTNITWHWGEADAE
jgi:hypothetical protein